MLAKYFSANQYNNRTPFRTVLKLTPQFDQAELNTKSRRLLAMFHPDNCGSDEIFHYISDKRNKARAFLTRNDPESAADAIVQDESDDEELVNHWSNNADGENEGGLGHQNENPENNNAVPTAAGDNVNNPIVIDTVDGASEDIGAKRKYPFFMDLSLISDTDSDVTVPVPNTDTGEPLTFLPSVKRSSSSTD